MGIDGISRHELLQLAGISPLPGLGVWVGPDQTILEDEEPIHTFPGMLISFRPIHRDPAVPYTLGQLLLFLNGWDEAPEWPESRFGPAHILVHRDRAALISASHPEPWRYREMIGEAVDVDPLHMHLFAAAPSPTDAALSGVHCRAVIAVGAPPPSAVQRYWHCVLVDCRHMQEGWLELVLYEGVLDVLELSTVLNDSAPPGWYVHIDVAPQRAGCIYLQPGYVILATYEDYPQTFPTGNESSTPQEAHGEATGEAGVTEVPSPGPSDAEDQPAPDDDAEEPATDAAAEEPTTAVTCYIFAPDFYPVEVDVPVHLPTTVEAFLGVARERRPAGDLPFFDNLCVVHPQPDPTYVCLLATPNWPTVGVPVLIQSLGDAPRTFAIFLPPAITHDDALMIVGVSVGVGFRAYHRDLPWPIPERGEIQLEPGDLLTVARPASYRPGWALADTLLWTYGWYQPEQPPGHWPGGTWLITDTEDRHAFAALPSGRTSLQIVADSLSLDPDTLFVCPAYPPIADHATKGRFSEAVVIAVVPEDHPRPEDVVYVLDQRPVLLPIRVMRAPGGRGAANHYRTVDFGDVIRVEFRVRRVSEVNLVSPAQASGTQDVQDPTTSSETHTTTEVSSSASRDAGTGGSFRDRTGGHSSTTHDPGLTWCTKGSAPIPTTLRRRHRARDSGPDLTQPADVACVALAVNQISAGIAFLIVGSLVYGVKSSVVLCHRPLLCLMLLLFTMQQVVVGVQILPPEAITCAAFSEGDSSFAARIRAVPRPLLSARGIERYTATPRPLGWSETPTCCLPTENTVFPGHSDGLETLLEQSLRRTDSPAMFLAATLVDTLCDHFEHDVALGPADLDEGCPDTVPLRLADHLPAARTFDLTSVQVHLGCTIDHVAALFQEGIRQLAPIPHIASGPARTWALECPPVGEDFSPHHARAIEVFTDGSFDGTTSAWAFHACGDWGDGFRSIGWVGDHVELDKASPVYLGAQAHGALQGELSALFWCLVWLLPLSTEVQVSILSDCVVAIGIAEGTAGQFRGLDLAANCRHVMQAVKARAPQDNIRIHHVRSHAGHVGNEAADHLAKASCRAAPRFVVWRDHPICIFLQREWLAWLWVYIATLRNPTHWPRQIGETLEDPALPAPPLPTPKECAAMLGLKGSSSVDGASPSAEAHVEASFLTVNVQSLCSEPVSNSSVESPQGFPGKAGLLREQLAEWQVGVVAMQETRAPKNETIQSQSHIRFCSARDDQGSYGTELWFSKLVPFIHHDLTPVYFRVDDFLAVHWNPRILAVRFCRGNLRILFVSLHAPTNASSHQRQWWEEFKRLLDRLRQGSQVVLLGDFNLHLHRASGDRVGDLHWHTPHPPPEIFWELLDAFDLWIPSTFSCCHPGPSDTWRSPNGNSTSRLDYTAIPAHWQVPAGGSSVVPELDWGQSRADHYALLVYTLFSVKFCPPKVGRKVRVDTKAMRTAAGKEEVRKICAALPEQPWHLDVHRHAAQIEAHFRTYLPISFPAPRARQIKPHFHPETWQLRCQRAWQRKRVYAAGHFCRQVSLRLLWARWRGSSGCEPRHRPGRTWARFLRYLKELPALIASLRESSATLRSLIRRDTQAYLHEVAMQATTGPTNCIVQRLRQLTGGPKRKQRGTMPLPAVETSEGQLAKTHAEAKARWIEHFAAIEDGQVQDPTAFVHSCYQRQSDKDLSLHMLSATDIPSLAELEAALRATSTDRAYGLDDIPGEVIRYGAAELSKSVYALLLKSIFRLTEPVQHKGGTLYCIWKGKGPKQICGSYRGILVSSMLGKSLHKTLRGRCSDILASATVPLQVGGLPRFPVTVPAQAARLFQSACHRHGRPYALLFLDLQEAFYRIIRPLITGDNLSDEQVAHVCSAVQLPAGTMHELHAYLGGTPILADAGSSTWASGAVSETLHDTWFRLPQEDDLVVTHTGSRPGDSLSDLVFSFLFAAVLKQVRKSLQDAGALARIPWCDKMDNNIGPLEAIPDSSLGVSDATWMDDLVMFLTSPNAYSLLGDLKVGASTLLDACLQRALVPNLTWGKTEAIVHVLGTGAKKVRSEIFGAHGGSVPLSCSLWPDARLRIVPVYRHLGGYLQHNGGLKQEIAFRTSQAWDAFNKRKKKLFQSPLVSGSDKAVFFNSLISTVLFHGAGTWTSVTDQHTTSTEATLRQMACQMLRPQFSADEAWHLGTMQALARAGIPRASTYLHIARLRHLLACSSESQSSGHWPTGKDTGWSLCGALCSGSGAS